MVIQGTKRYVNFAALVSVVVLLVGISTLATGIRQTADSWRWVIHTREVLEHVQGTESLINEVDALQKSLRLQGDRRDRADFDAKLAELPRELQLLTRLTSDNPAQQRALAGVRALLDTYARDLRIGLERDATYPSRDAERALREAIDVQVSGMRGEEERLLALRQAAVYHDRTRMIGAAVAVSVLSVALLLFVQSMARRDAAFLAAERGNLDTTLRSIGEAVIAVDEHGRVRFLNRIAEQLLRSAEMDVRGQPLAAVFRIGASPADAAALQDVLQTALSERRPVSGVSIAGSAPGQPPVSREWLLTCYPMVVGDRLHGAVLSLLDVTDLKRAQRALGDANLMLEQRIHERTEQLAEANLELRAFAHTIAHDLRAPLRNVQGYAAALQEDEAARLSATGKIFLARIGAVAANMDRLVAELLVYSQLSRSELRLQPVELDRVVQLALQDLDAQVAAGGARIDVARPLPAVTGNEAVLTQVFENLIGNALKFVAPGVRPEIAIGAEVRGSDVLVRVRDNGIGIPEDKRDRVFDMFERLHGDDQYQGTGIGLAIVRKGVERQGGSVRVEPGAAAGTVFLLTLRSADGAP